MRRNKKKSKKIKQMIASIAIVFILSSIAIAGALLYYANISAEVNVSNLIDINGGPAENTAISVQLNGYPNDTINETYILKAYRDTTIYFNVDSDTEIQTTIYYNSNPITQLNLVENVNTTIEIQYYIQQNATSGNYWSNITIDQNP